MSEPQDRRDLFLDLLAEVERQDRAHPAGFPASRDGLRLGLAAAGDELAEARDEWRAERCRCGTPDCSHPRWERTYGELVQTGAVILRMLRSIEQASTTRVRVPHQVDHSYVSTACYHGRHERCRLTCKFCPAPCRCQACTHDEALAAEATDAGLIAAARRAGLDVDRLDWETP